MHPALADLLEEHRAARRVLEATRGALEPFNPVRLKRGLLFLKYVIDRVHHAKEEDALFAAMLERSQGEDRALVERIQAGHQQGHGYLKAAESLLSECEQGSLSALPALAQTIEAYAQFTLGHMRQEEQVVFPLAERLLDEEAQSRLLARFAQVKSLLIGPRDYELYLDFARDPGRLETLVMAPSKPVEAEPATRIIQKGRVLQGSNAHRCVHFTSTDSAGATLNHYLIVDGAEALLFHPGRTADQAELELGVGEHLDGATLKFLGWSDPHEVTGLGPWLMRSHAVPLASDPEALRCIEPIPPGAGPAIPTEGGCIMLGSAELLLLPAHHLPNPLGHHLYDPIAKILYSGELGASVGPAEQLSEGFEDHAARLLPLHQARMASRAAVQAWVRMVRTLPLRMIAPRRGPIMVGPPMVSAFLDWCEATPCGLDRRLEGFQIPSQRLA